MESTLQLSKYSGDASLKGINEIKIAIGGAFGADDECDVNHGWDGYVRDGIASTMLLLKTIWQLDAQL